MEFGLLGPLTVRRGDRQLAIPLGKPRAVLAVLLARTGQVVPADELMELIWDSRPPPSARGTLHNHVKRLRRALGEPTQARVKTVNPGYLIVTGPAELDLTRFSALCSEGRKAAGRGEWERATSQLTAALSLWRGQPLLDIPCPLLTISEVPRLEELRAAALEDRLDADLHLGRHHEVLAELQQLVIGQRLRERTYALLMLALYRAGRRADALAAYQVARRELIRELGLEPGAELRLLHRQILVADACLDLAKADKPVATVQAVVPRQLPAAGAAFAGRQEECRVLTDLLMLRRHSPANAFGICVIGGSPGIGKTTLAVHWAHQITDQFPDGQLHVDLHGFGPAEPMDPADALLGFLAALGVPATQIPQGAAARAGLYRSLLASRRMLVLLDNASAASQVRPLLPGGPDSLVVITSRNRLAGLAVAEGAHMFTLGPLTDSEAHELLIGRLGPQRMARESAAVDDLIRICAGLPLALAAAATRITTTPGLRVASVTRELTNVGSSLEVLETGDAATSVRAAFTWSCLKLSAPAAHLLQLVRASGTQGITLPVAARLARIPKDHARRLLAELTRAHLASEPAPGRFTIHPLMYAYAAEEPNSAPVSAIHPQTSRRELVAIHTPPRRAERSDLLAVPADDPGSLSQGLGRQR